ncbi:MAG: hypothetical protein HFF09_01735 [Oscillospiraceae bacterium]|nr:hypothetical protein [Oscillospiraceae bacterium]
MTNLQVEERLIKMAQALPEPTADFSDLLTRLDAPLAEKHKRRHPVRRAVLVCLAAVALTFTIAAGYGSYQLSNHGACVWPARASGLRSEYGVAIPEQLSGYPLQNADHLLVVPYGVPYEASPWKQVYRYAVLYYKTEDIIGPTVAVGSTDNPYWAACFSYDPDALTWVGDSRYAYLNQTATEYGGHTLYLYDTSHVDLGDNRTFVTHTATWVDAEQSVCWQVSGHDTAETLSAAKELIDANT